jgi:hypothetical protein
MTQEEESSNFPEDTGLDDISSFIQQIECQLPNATDTPYINPTIDHEDMHTSTRMHLNLIRHCFGRPTELNTLQLFKSFMSAVRKADNKLTKLPIDSTKQQFTALTTQKQIDTLMQNAESSPLIL